MAVAVQFRVLMEIILAAAILDLMVQVPATVEHITVVLAEVLVLVTAAALVMQILVFIFKTLAAPAAAKVRQVVQVQTVKVRQAITELLINFILA
jgi:hypothetical protein